MRITTRRRVGWLTSAKPAAAKMLRLPTWSSPQRDLLPGLRDHRVALEGTGAAFPREVDGGARERTADPAAPEARAGDEAGHGPDAVVGLVLRSALPGDAGVAQQARVGGARLDRAPADGLAVDVGDETTVSGAPRGCRSRSARAGGTGAAPRRRPRPRTPRAASCSAGTGICDGSPRVPSTAWRSSQLASLAGTIVTSGVAESGHADTVSMPSQAASASISARTAFVIGAGEPHVLVDRMHPQHGGLAVGGGVDLPDEPVAVEYREREVAPAALAPRACTSRGCTRSRRARSARTRSWTSRSNGDEQRRSALEVVDRAQVGVDAPLALRRPRRRPARRPRRRGLAPSASPWPSAGRCRASASRRSFLIAARPPRPTGWRRRPGTPARRGPTAAPARRARRSRPRRASSGTPASG